MPDIYESPFNSRYASREMKRIFSPDRKFKTWRLLWIALAEAEKELGLDITDKQINDLKKYKNDINYDLAEKREKEIRHDVMAHVYAYGEQCPDAKGIIHLGATSCYVGDNTDIILMLDALKIVREKIIAVIKNLSDFALKYKDMATLGYTHYQPAQPVTVGKRATLWIQDLLMDLKDTEYVISTVKFLGSKGTTGTQASFLKLFNNDNEKVKKLDTIIAQKLGFSDTIPVSGQTYTRKQDTRIVNVLSGIAQSAYKFSNDLRLLQSRKEIEEPFEQNQIGSSAMAYKRNPMRSERISALSRYVIINSLNPQFTASTQWFERTLDDSANKRICIPEAFLGVDAILNLYINITGGLVVYPYVIRKNLMDELPFMATENILMEAVKKGGDRQLLHERIRFHSMNAARRIKEEGKENDLLERILSDKLFGLSDNDLTNLIKPEYFIGRSVKQVEEFIVKHVKSIIEEHNTKYMDSEINV
jgi:adenylosuccinate lyase